MFIHTYYFFIHMPVPDQLFPRASLERLVDSDCLQLRKDKQKNVPNLRSWIGIYKKKGDWKKGC